MHQRVLIACGVMYLAAGYADVATTPPPNVLIVLFDSLRADHTEPYGATPGSTPGIARLAAEGCTFKDVLTPSSFTPCVISTMMTTAMPWEHGVLGRSAELPESLPYLPQLLHDHGYYTVGITQNGHISSAFGFARGYDQYHEIYRDADRKWDKARTQGPAQFANRVWDTLLKPSMEGAGKKPFFVYLHLIDPHGPYDAPAPYSQRYFSGTPPIPNTTPDTINAILKGSIPATPENIAYLESQYHGEVAYMDEVLSGLMTRLDQSGVTKNTVVVFLSDHGEAFWEHQSLHHWLTLYEEVLRVPLIIRFPGHVPANSTIARPASLYDLPQTLLTLLGMPTLSSIHGQDLFDAEKPHPPRLGALRPYMGADYRLYAQDGALKLIESGQGGNASFELFNLKNDAAEKLNLWPAQKKKRRPSSRRLRPLTGESLRGSPVLQPQARLMATRPFTRT